ncbi:AraC family transcriptional regulator [Pelosinus sp. sgz500959]|uniref:AraC family transcriptional regulator n=1 Tax=Pelosinus sp. sgz500959 TaxID=3242472 RepID=UPI00366C9B27
MLLYHKALEQAVEYIEKHLKQSIKVEDVANHVNISYFHFHRIFFAATGEVLGDYIIESIK